MDIILAADAITPPLTGIGRYAYELACRLPTHPDVGSVRYFAFGRWLDAAELTRAEQGAIPSGLPVPQTGRSLRSILAANPLAVKAYHALTPTLYRWRLRHDSKALFHSPNYFLPPFGGSAVATVHDLSHIVYPKFHPQARITYLNRALPDTLRRARHIITDAESVRSEFIQQFGWPADRITAIPLGVDQSFSPTHRESCQPVLNKYGLASGRYSLYVGTVEPRKNIVRLMTAYERLPPSTRDQYPLVIVGSRGWLSDAIFGQMDAGIRKGWIRYLDFVPQAELPSLYAGATLFAYVSLYEGFGLPLIEAMASGIPIVTSDTSSMPEVVGDVALLADPFDVDCISARLQQGLEDNTWRAQAIQQGLHRSQEFTWQRCVDLTVALYRQLSP